MRSSLAAVPEKRSVGTNWAGNQQYSARGLLRPHSIDELCEQVASSSKVKPVGSRHSFSTIADTAGDMLDLSALPRFFDLAEESRTVTIDAGMRYGELATRLQAHGWALENMASLPHITVVGSVATGTHGSGDSIPPLSAAVRSVEMILADGSLRQFHRGEEDFGGAAVNLGALGVVTRVTLDITPTFQVRQDVYDGLEWGAVLESFDDLAGAAYSVSLFTRWVGDRFGHAWLKSTGEPAERVLGVPALRRDIGLVEGAVERTTPQCGVWGSWDQRLPHFKLDFTPSNGSELQSEYLLPRSNAVEALQRLWELGPRMEPHLLLSEVRTIAADEQWMSTAYGRESVGFHFTWRQHPEEVRALLPRLEEQLLPLGARPHWGKLFDVTDLGPMYPRSEDFQALATRLDPGGTFRNDFLATHLFS